MGALCAWGFESLHSYNFYSFTKHLEDKIMKYHVVITYEVWNGEQSIEHEYDAAAQAAAVYERVCRIWEHKGYQRLGYGECWEQVFEKTDRYGNEVNYTVELY